MADEKIVWEAPEFVYHQKTSTWYWVSILLALSCLAYAIFTQNFLFMVFIVIAEILLVIWSRELPHMVEFAVQEDGIRVGEKDFYPFKELGSFSVHEHAHGSELILRRKKSMTQFLKIPLVDGEIGKVETYLQKKLQQKDHEDSLVDSIFHLTRF